jgi:hypothetical protein
MRRIWQLVGFIIVLGLIVVAFAAAGLLFVVAVRAGSAFWAAFVAALATVGAAGLIRDFERRKSMEALRREELGPIYNQMAQVLHGQEIPEDERLQLIDDFLRKSLVYASPATLKAYRAWYVQLPSEEDWPKEAFRPNSLRYEAFVKAMRKDLGVRNLGLQDGDLARMRISDFDQFL